MVKLCWKQIILKPSNEILKQINILNLQQNILLGDTDENCSVKRLATLTLNI